MLWCPIFEERRAKYELIMHNLSLGWRDGARCITGQPPDDGNPVAAYGQIWGSEKVLKQACRSGRPYYHIDNGYWHPGRGSAHGYYRICYMGMTPVFLLDMPDTRAHALGVQLKPWRMNGRHILLGLPGLEYGAGIGLDMMSWVQRTRAQLPGWTDRPIIVRDRKSAVPLEQHLHNCWAVVTHSSNIAVDAVCAGIPAFVMPTSMAVPVGNLELSKLETPEMPDRMAWMNSLACQQFMPREMADGTAYDFMMMVKKVWDAATQSSDRS
jgi:hypothetical protein